MENIMATSYVPEASSSFGKTLKLGKSAPGDV